MTNDEIIDRLQDLIYDRESFLSGDSEYDIEFIRDIDALKAAINKIMKMGGK